MRARARARYAAEEEKRVGKLIKYSSTIIRPSTGPERAGAADDYRMRDAVPRWSLTQWRAILW